MTAMPTATTTVELSIDTTRFAAALARLRRAIQRLQHTDTLTRAVIASQRRRRHR